MSSPQNADSGIDRMPVSGRFTGAVALVTGVVMIGTGLWDFDATTDLITSLGLLLVILSWVVLMRPAVWADREDLVLRGSFTTTRIPLAGVDSLRLGNYLEVDAGGSTYTNASLSAKDSPGRRPTARGATRAPGPGAGVSVHDLWLGRLQEMTRGGRARAGVSQDSPEQYALGQQARREVEILPATLVCVGVAAVLLALLVN